MNEYQPFLPARGLANRHLQTLLPVMLGRSLQVGYVRQELQLPDGDFVDLDWNSIPEQHTRKPILIVFHGLEGSSRSHYAKALMRAAHDRGWHGVVMNFRSCSGRQNRMARMYHSGDSADAGYFIDWLRQRYPVAALFAVGYSLGGNMLLKLAGEQQDALPLDALVSVSAPVRLDIATRYMVQGLPRLYQAYLLRSLKRKVLDKYRYHDYRKLIGLERQELLACTDIRQFDDLFTSRLHGFADAQDYYNRCSAFQYLHNINKPCLILHAQDDPVAPISVLGADISLPANVRVQVTHHGGHVGYLGGSLYRPSYWLTHRILAYLSGFMQS